MPRCPYNIATYLVLILKMAMEAALLQSSAAPRLVRYMDVDALLGHATEPLRTVNRAFRAMFSEGPALWRALYHARWRTTAHAPLPAASTEWRSLYISRHRGEISPDPMQRPVKRKNPWTSKGGASSYKRAKRYEAIPGC